MKKYLVVGNPIKHSLSPILHNYWIKNNNINAIYEKLKLDENEIQSLILKVKKKEIQGINVTVPFKKIIIPYLDKLTFEAKNTESVNTIYLDGNKIIGHNTDIDGFEVGIKNLKSFIENKKVLILGAGGVVPSIIFALKKMNTSEIIISNRTKKKAENIKKLFKNLTIHNWGSFPEFDMIINATSIGLNNNDEIDLDFSKIGRNKLFYDVIYNPVETNFLKIGKKLGNKTENGKLMFIYQAYSAFNLWHKVQPKINQEVINLLDQ
ncbi:shikimate dehydrogenase [Candidatus Pelagibacter sp.]|nr:shikimate dehydrogenase [Candidatus Pelagibacter sp.]MDA9631419.1 shikimate dehydrogenase [Candidatus Pelagibacter sp.]|tara:strand:+ start:246 stop:1040 length:795 start_codon:yes stop_codon:yes gene_type:complete